MIGAPRASRIGLTAWLVAGLALAGYAGAAAVALRLNGVSPPMPLWGLAGPPVVYAIVAVAALRQLSVIRALAVMGALCTAHALLLAATAVVVAIAVPSLLDGDARAPFLSARLGSLALACVVLMLAPVQPLVEARPRYSRRAAPTAPAPPHAPAPAPILPTPPHAPVTAPILPAPPQAPVTAPGGPSVWTPPHPATPAARPGPSPFARAGQVEPVPAAGRSPAKAAPTWPPPWPTPGTLRAPAAPTPAAPAIPKPAAPVLAGPEPRGESVPSLRAAEPVEEIIRIPFARVVDQFPAEIFRLSPDRVGATLLEAGHLLIPEPVVRPQLGKGLVQVDWQIVAHQFPRHALALPHDEIARRLPNASIVLPLDEVVRQVRPDVFALSTPTVDVRGLEDFPPPFQPYVPPSAAADEPDAAASVAETALEATEPASARPGTAGPPEMVPSGPPALELASLEPLAAGPSSEAAPEPVPQLEPSRGLEARRIAALLGPLLSPVCVETCERKGATFLTLAPPALGAAALADVAERVLPLLTDGRLPEPAMQATVRGTAMTAVITPLAGTPDSALVMATTSGASLALLERLSLQAAAGPVARERRPQPPAPATPPGARLREATPTPPVRAVAESLHAFGPVTASVLRDLEGALMLYLFLPPGVEARALGGFARDLHRALAGSPVGMLSSVVIRAGSLRLLLRVVEAPLGRSILVAGAGSVERPGMARLELERAAAHLGRL